MSIERSSQKQENMSFLRRNRSWIMLGIIVLVVVLYLLVPGINSGMNKFLSPLASGNIDTVVEFIRSYKGYAAVISCILMVLSSVIAPLPAFLITLSNAVIFGWWQGAILSWSSAMLGAALCFFISRSLGRDTVEKLAGRGALQSVEKYFEKYGTRTILICRLLPFVSFDAVSYFAGLTPMTFWPFFMATGIGQLPATLVYSYVGGTLTGGAQALFFGLTALFGLAIMITILKQIYDGRQKDKA